MTGELILSDSINLVLISPSIYQVTASVMAPTDKRENALNVSITWNVNDGIPALKTKLQAAYTNMITDPNATLKANIISQICTDIPASTPATASLNYVINCNSVTVNPAT